MPKIVVKIGGSNLRHKGSFDKVINTIREYDRPLVVVVSAFYGITDKLIDIIDKVKSNRDEINELTSFLLQMKRSILDRQIKEENVRAETYSKLKERVEELKRYLLGIYYIGESPAFIRDVVLSYGERLSSLVLASVLQYHNLDVEEALPENIGLITNGKYGRSTIDYKRSEAGLVDSFSDDKIYVVPGFYGISQTKQITLLGRGGTDYSAASIARCINAQSLDIWKDVDGFLTADPKLVNNVKRVQKLSYTEAAELTFFGAKILHPLTISALEGTDIPVRIFNINNSIELDNPFSIIDSQSNITPCVIKSVTYNDDFACLKIMGLGIGLRPRLIAEIVEQFGRAHVHIKSIMTSKTAITFLIVRKDLEKASAVIKKLELDSEYNLEILNDISVVTLIGEGLEKKVGLAAKIFNAIEKENINLLNISEGASPVMTYFIVNREERTKAVRAIHKEFFE